MKTFILLFLLLVSGLPAAAQLLPEGTRVVAGEPVSVEIPEGVDTLTLVYRPNAAIARQERIPLDGSRLYSWTPPQAGVVRLSAGEVSQNVSVRYTSPPLSGIFVLLLAGTILFGGAAYSLRKLFSD